MSIDTRRVWAARAESPFLVGGFLRGLKAAIPGLKVRGFYPGCYPRTGSPGLVPGPLSLGLKVRVYPGAIPGLEVRGFYPGCYSRTGSPGASTQVMGPLLPKCGLLQYCGEDGIFPPPRCWPLFAFSFGSSAGVSDAEGRRESSGFDLWGDVLLL